MSHFTTHQQQCLFRLVLCEEESEIQGKSPFLSGFQACPNSIDISQLPTPETDQEVLGRSPQNPELCPAVLPSEPIH